MKSSDLSQRIQLYVRVVAVFLLIEIISEFGDQQVLGYLGFKYNSVTIHLIKLGLAVCLLIPPVLLWLYQDSRQLKRIQTSLDETEQDYHSLFEHNPYAVYLLDYRGDFIAANPAFSMMTGYSRAEIREVGSKHPWLFEENRETVREHFERARAGNPQHYETTFVTKAGCRLQLDITYLPMYRRGEIHGVYAIAQDITSRTEAEQQLSATQTMLNAFINYTGDAISIADANGRIKLVNPAWERQYGWTLAELEGSESPVLRKYHDAVLRGEEVVSVECVAQRKDGSDITVNLTTSPIYAPDGTVMAVSNISKNITERKRTEELLLQSEKLTTVGQLAAGIAHEIRNPLTSIQGFLSLMREHYNPHYLSILQSEVHRINEITNEFLLLAKPSEKPRTRENLVTILDEVLVLMEGQAHLHNIQFHIQKTAQVLKVPCIKSQIKQAFINLIKNSIEALPEGGNIYIELVQKNHDVQVVLSDDGPGIPEERLLRLGQPFYTTKERGTGLGLMVTYRIIQNHNGHISVESSPSAGTRVEVLLPAHEDRQFCSWV
jgi:PAS domain S-box-containing protein